LNSRNGWIVERTESGWSEPRHISSPVEMIENDGILYVSAQFPGGRGLSDIYRLRYEGVHYGMPENLQYPINTELDEYVCCVPKDERFIIFYRFHPEKKDIRGLYYSFHKNKISWTEPASLSRILKLNSCFSATLSPDEKYLFVLNRGDGIYWIETCFVDECLME